MMKRLLIVCAVLPMLLFLIGTAIAGSLPDTGQTKCYDDVGNEIDPCPSPGEDFYGQDANYAPCNPQSYTTLGGGIMVQDNVTGLIWEVKQDKDDVQNYANPHDADNEYTWYDGDTGTPGDGISTYDIQQHFIDVLNNAEFGGYDDWRMPTVKELSTLVDSSILYPGPTINIDYFPNTVSSFYWPSTTYVGRPNVAWHVLFYTSDVHRYYMSFYYHARAVRSGQCGSFGDFVDNSDGTVTDTSTGLMWEVKESKDGTPDYGNPHDADNEYTWEDALSLCENLSFAGHDDWRLPNRNELQSLVDYSQEDPSIDTTYFPNTVSSYYWSSTTYANYPHGAWYIYFSVGGVDLYYKSDYTYVRAVRAGQCGPFGDSDGDGVGDACDNCGSTPNGSLLGTCISCNTDSIGGTCTSDGDCGTGESCAMNQEDICSDDYPPGGNSCGDACECEGDFDNDLDVDGADTTTFLADLGRLPFDNPCTIGNPCNGDFDCDGDVDGADTTKFMEDLGRYFYNQPCPQDCQTGEWCVYTP